MPGSPAAKAGFAPGMNIIAVNGRKFSKEILREVLKSAKTTISPTEFIVANGDFYSIIKVNYHGGEKYPYLKRDKSKPDILDSIIKPLTYR